MTEPGEGVAETLAVFGVVVVDVRHAGGAVYIGTDENPSAELFGGCVRLELPGNSPIPVYPREARALAAALIAAADYSEQKNAPDALQRGEGDDEAPVIQEGHQS